MMMMLFAAISTSVDDDELDSTSLTLTQFYLLDVQKLLLLDFLERCRIRGKWKLGRRRCFGPANVSFHLFC